MIIIKSDPEVDLMRQAGRITAGARTIARQMVAPGVTTRQINREVHKFITKSGATPCFMTDGGFPTAACIATIPTCMLCCSWQKETIWRRFMCMFFWTAEIPLRPPVRNMPHSWRKKCAKSA